MPDMPELRPIFEIILLQKNVCILSMKKAFALPANPANFGAPKFINLLKIYLIVK